AGGRALRVQHGGIFGRPQPEPGRCADLGADGVVPRRGGGEEREEGADEAARLRWRVAGMKPLAVDLFCGLGGWSEGLLAEGYEVIGFDIERHDFREGQCYTAQLVLQDALQLHGYQFKDAALIVASPPCQEYSYMAMPWSRAKQREREYRDGTRKIEDLNRLFEAAIRIGAQAGVPLVIENVRGAIPWVGRSRWNYGSSAVGVDLPALMPMPVKRGAMKAAVTHRIDWST